MKNAYVSLLSSNNYIYAAIALMYSGKNTYSKYPFVLLVTKDISEANKNIARAIGYQVIEIDEFVPKPMQNPAIFSKDEKQWYGEKQDDNGWRHVYSKLLAFSLIQFNKVCFIDLDSLVLQNMDNVFDYPGFSTVHWNNDNMLNTAFFVIEPNATLSQDILNFAEVHTQAQPDLTIYTDFEVLNQFFQADIYNYDKGIPSINYYDFWLLKDNNLNLLTEWPNLKAVHFGGRCKPGMGGYAAAKSELFSVYMEYMGLFYLDVLNTGLEDIKAKKIAPIEVLVQ